MKHPEFIYLVERAYVVRHEEIEAFRDGEVFVSLDPGVTLSDGTHVKVRIFDDHGIETIELLATGPNPQGTAHAFFPGFYRRLANHGEAARYVSTELPRPLRPRSSNDSRNHPVHDGGAHNRGPK